MLSVWGEKKKNEKKKNILASPGKEIKCYKLSLLKK